MIGAFLGLVLIAAVAPSRPAAASGLSPATALQRYAATLEQTHEPRVISFDYTLEQTGARTLEQTHRVFRAGSDERDETLTVDGKPLIRPIVRIFRGRRNRYTLALLAPRLADYNFTFLGPRRDAHHIDYVFKVTSKAPREFAITGITIDGARFLPVVISFATHASRGVGSIVFGSNGKWWVPYAVSARAMVASDLSTERLTFYTYRFPETLPPSTFRQAPPAPAPLTGTPVAPGR